MLHARVLEFAQPCVQGGRDAVDVRLEVCPVGGFELLEVEHPDVRVRSELVDIEGSDVAEGGHCVEMLDWIHSARERGMGRDGVRWEEADDARFGCT
jgi:hypothetical protein